MYQQFVRLQVLPHFGLNAGVNWDVHEGAAGIPALRMTWIRLQ
jgi:hypothetical protein